MNLYVLICIAVVIVVVITICIIILLEILGISLPMIILFLELSDRIFHIFMPISPAPCGILAIV